MTAEEIFQSFRRHGGRLSDARAVFPSAPLPWIDLSTGVNPAPWQGTRATDADLTRLPDPADLAALEAAAAAAFGCDPARVAAVPGADHGLRLLPWLTKAAHVAIASPTYQGHADAWRTKGAEIFSADGPALRQGINVDAIVIVNPNNPDGAVIPRDVLLDIAACHTGWLIVDKSFADVMPECSVAAHAHSKLIVLRSFGKFYGLPGIRLGFIIADPEVITAVRGMTGDWPVSADAIALGCAAYADRAWQVQAHLTLAQSAARLDECLIRAGFNIVGGTPLFRLASCADAANRFVKLAQAGILVRPFDFAPTWLRFGIPAADAWPRLETALENCQ